MAEDQKLALDESQRIARHEAIKSTAREGVEAEVARHANALDEREQARVANMGERMRTNAVDEVVSTEAEISRARGVARISQVIDYVFYLVYGIITLKIILDLIGANRGNAFRSFVDALASPLLAPFNNLIPDPAAGRFQFRISYVIALVVYFLLHLAINGLLRMIAQRKTTI